jgi:hypothetical protein
MGKKCNRKLVPMTICEFVGIDPYETFCGMNKVESLFSDPLYPLREWTPLVDTPYFSEMGVIPS